MFLLKKLLPLLLALTANAQQQQDGYHPSYLTHEFGSRLEQNQEQSRPAEYNYSYDVRDDRTGDWKSQQESRMGDVVRGSYAFLDADGSTRSVQYTVDHESGFNAVIRRDGDQISLPNTESRNFPGNHNVNHSRRPSSRTNIHRNNLQSGRYFHPTPATRLAQDARTGYVVDLHSGFGAVSPARTQNNPLFTGTSSLRENVIERQSLSEDRYDQFEAIEAAIPRSLPEVQQVSTRSQYHISHTTDHYPETPVQGNYRYNTGLRQTPSHFNTLATTPNSQVDVRRPSAILPDSNTSNRPDNININRQDSDEQSSNYQTDIHRIYHQNRDINIGSTNRNQDQSNYNSMNLNFLYNHEDISGSTTQQAVESSGQELNIIQENNRRNQVLFGQPNNYFGARINVNNRPIQTETRLMSTSDDSEMINSLESSDPNHTFSHAEGRSNAVYNSQIYPENLNFHNNVPEFAQRYVYPASTFPLDAETHDHFITSDSSGSPNESSLITIDDYNVHTTSPSDAIQLSPIHYSNSVNLIH